MKSRVSLRQLSKVMADLRKENDNRIVSPSKIKNALESAGIPVDSNVAVCKTLYVGQVELAKSRFNLKPVDATSIKERFKKYKTGRAYEALLPLLSARFGNVQLTVDVGDIPNVEHTVVQNDPCSNEYSRTKHVISVTISPTWNSDVFFNYLDSTFEDRFILSATPVRDSIYKATWITVLKQKVILEHGYVAMLTKWWKVFSKSLQSCIRRAKVCKEYAPLQTYIYAEDLSLPEFVEKFGDVVVTVEDSVQALNCKGGSIDIAEQMFGVGTRKAKIRDIVSRMNELNFSTSIVYKIVATFVEAIARTYEDQPHLLDLSSLKMGFQHEQ